MKPLPLTKLDGIKPLLEEAIAELNLGDRTTIDFLINRIKIGFTQRSIDAYVDQVEGPRHLIVFEKSHGGVTNESLLEIRFIFSTKEERGAEGVTEMFKEQIDAYSELFPFDAILASSWVYEGASPIAALWKGWGFKKQEVVYVKTLDIHKEGGAS